MPESKKQNILMLGNGWLAPALLMPLVERANARDLVDVQVFPVVANGNGIPAFPTLISQLSKKGTAPKVTLLSSLQPALSLQDDLEKLSQVIKQAETTLLVLSLGSIKATGQDGAAHQGIFIENWPQMLATLLYLRFLAGLQVLPTLFVTNQPLDDNLDNQLLTAARRLYGQGEYLDWLSSAPVVLPAYGQRMYRSESVAGEMAFKPYKSPEDTLDHPVRQVLQTEAFGRLLIHSDKLPAALLPLLPLGEELQASATAGEEHLRQSQLFRAVLLFADLMGSSLKLTTPAQVMDDPDARAFLAATLTWELAPSLYDQRIAGLDATLQAFHRLEGGFFNSLGRNIPRLAFAQWLAVVHPYYTKRMQGHQNTRMLTLLFALVFLQLIQLPDDLPSPGGWWGMSVDMDPGQLAYAALRDEELWADRLSEDEQLFDALREAFLDLQVLGLRAAMQRRLHEQD